MMSDVQFEDPTVSRIKVSTVAGKTVIVIPPVRHAFVMIFLTAWLGGWTFGGVAAFSQFREQGGAFLGFWLLAWAVGEILAVGSLLWMLLGREVVTANLAQLTHAYRVLFWSRMRHYRPASVSNLRWVPGEVHSSENSTRSSVSFEYGNKTVSFSKGADAGEGNFIVRTLNNAMGIKGGSGERFP